MVINKTALLRPDCWVLPALLEGWGYVCRLISRSMIGKIDIEKKPLQELADTRKQSSYLMIQVHLW